MALPEMKWDRLQALRLICSWYSCSAREAAILLGTWINLGWYHVCEGEAALVAFLDHLDKEGVKC